MTDITNIKQYLEWKAEREGRKIDTSPEAWELERASESVIEWASLVLDGLDDESEELWRPLDIALNDYRKAYNDLNGELNAD